MSDLLSVSVWWLVWFALGLAFLPLTFHFFSSFWDRGYIFAKILGLMVLVYAVWLISSLHILPFSNFSIFVPWFGFVILNIYLARKMSVREITLGKIKIFAFEELLFLAGFLFWVFIRAHEPSIHGLEKYMDFGFINSILRSEFFPPKDLWMSPLTINYYYFGHLVVAVLTKISGLSPTISYNLLLAALFGITLSASFSIGANLYQKLGNTGRRLTVVAGLISAFLVTLGGNLHTIYAFFQNYVPDNPVPFWTLLFKFNFEGYWYPSATRFIPFTIHEFPLYSFVVADLHGHVLNIPFVLLLIAFLIAIFHNVKLQSTHYLLLALLMAVFLMTNVLDAPIYLLGLFLLLFAKHGKNHLTQVFKSIGIILVLTIFFSLPFWASFKPFGSGIGVLCAPQFLIDQGKIGPLVFEADHCARSPLWMLFILWGFFYSVVLVFSFKYLRSLKKLKSFIADNLLIFALILFATILIIIPEFFYVKDIYPVHYRANTVFKFGYQAFIILGFVSGYLLTKMISSKKLIPLILLAPLFLLISIYPYFAINSYYGGLKNYQGLDGLNYLSQFYPTDYQAILWIRDNISGQPVILEAQGDSYSDFARVSSNTGLPTVIGWPVHEWLWRGTYQEAGLRVSDVSLLFESPDINLTQSLLKKYNVSYVFIGDLERQKYLNLNEVKFESLGKVIFQSNQTKIYQLK